MVSPCRQIDMKRIFAILIIFVTVFAVFYALLVVPNDKRIRMTSYQPKSGPAEELYFDMTKNLVNARMTLPNLSQAQKLLDKYEFKQAFEGTHNGPLNMHVSLGWFPLKTKHRDSIFAPGNSRIEYTLTLCRAPVLKFDYGIISSMNGRQLKGTEFSVTVTGEDKAEETVFSAAEKPLKTYFWNYYDKTYKNFIKYFKPGLEDRDGKWNYAEVDLAKYAGKKVVISFVTKQDSGLALSFWGKPCVYDRAPDTGKRLPSVVLVVIDSFKRSHMRTEYSPAIVSMAAEGVDFTRALSNGNNTKLSVYSLLASRYPFEMPETAMHYNLSKNEKQGFYRRKIKTLPALLGESGFRTAAIGSVSLFSDGHGLSGDTGFDEYINLEQSGYSPPHVTEETLRWLQKHASEKFFLLVYYYGPHGPYRPPVRYGWKALRTGQTENLRDALYAGDIMYHDDYLRVLKDYIKSSPALKDTVVIVTSDHGVAFRSAVYDWPAKYGAWKKKKISFHSHGVSVTPDDLNVPLLFWNTGVIKSVTEKVQLLDLAPTIAETAGIKIPAEFKGQSLKGLMEGRPFSEPVTFHEGVTNRGVYWKDKYLYVNNFRPREGFPKETVVPEELYDLDSDSGCLKNLAAAESPALTKMRGFFGAMLARDEENRIVYSGPEGTTALVSVTVSGAFEIIETSSTVRERGRRSFTAQMSSGQSVSFTTHRRRSGIRITASSGGLVLGPQDILYGGSALPLNQSFVIKPEDRGYYMGLPERFKATARPLLLFGIFAKENTSSEDLRNAPKQLKSMLEQWGYIN